MAIPLFWTVLNKPGNSDTDERIALMTRFLEVFGAERIGALLADREFVGERWFQWLQQQGIPFHQRLKRNTLVSNDENPPVRLDALLSTLKPGEGQHLTGPQTVWGCTVQLSALRLENEEFLFIASSGVPQAEAIDAYADRWQVETLFGALKTRGFHLEDTHLADPERLSKLMGLLALAFAWTYRTRIHLHDTHRPIPLKNPGKDPLSLSFDTASTSSAMSSST